ncbi:MAG: secondary thiamine-phosphate synthase enzyme YjbQ [Burkholderiaceae bacterium]
MFRTFQEGLTFRTEGRGSIEITQAVEAVLKKSELMAGTCHVFVQHTSASLMITENADPRVRQDLETLLGRFAPDADPAYAHDDEGDDDMAAHARSILTGSSVTVPIGKHKLLLGTWQGIYLYEHRAQGYDREVIVTLTGRTTIDKDLARQRHPTGEGP